jgi:hypothetical protein
LNNVIESHTDFIFATIKAPLKPYPVPTSDNILIQEQTQVSSELCGNIEVCFTFIELITLFPFSFFFFFGFIKTGFLCSPGCPETHFVDQAGLELRNLPASASQVLGLKVCTTMPGSHS